MALYSSEAGDLAQEYRAALSAQTEAIRALAAGIKRPLVGPSSVAVMHTLEFHEQRVRELKRQLEPFRVDQG
jgi:hypothetical protein